MVILQIFPHLLIFFFWGGGGQPMQDFESVHINYLRLHAILTYVCGGGGGGGGSEIRSVSAQVAFFFF